MNFTDTQVQACFELKLIDQASGISDDVRAVGALIATHDWFRMLEGSHSSRVHETLEHLLSPGVRPGLRAYYRRGRLDTNSSALAFKDHLSRLTGERFEKGEGLTPNPA
jgi:hypothetical protein